MCGGAFQMPRKDNVYNEYVSFQKDNLENKGKLKSQNTRHNTKKEALGPNTRRNVY